MRFLIPGLLQSNPNFRRYFLGQSVSLLGDQVTLLAIPLLAVLVLHARAEQTEDLQADGVRDRP